MLFIGICGASGRKNHAGRGVSHAIGASSVTLKQDAYYFDHPDLSFSQRAALNYDEPQLYLTMIYCSRMFRRSLGSSAVTAKAMTSPSMPR